MKSLLPIILVLGLFGCNGVNPPPTDPTSTTTTTLLPIPGPDPDPLECGKLKIEGRFILCADDSIFRWRGITWFRYVQQVANGEDTSYLEDLHELGFNLIRTLTNAEFLFDLPADEGLAALDEALDIALENGFYVEVVGNTDTALMDFDWKAHTRSVFEICAQHINCVAEYVNEPGHDVNDPEMHDLRHVTELAAEAASGLDLIYSAGASNTDEYICVPSEDNCLQEETPHPIGDYLTPHLNRDRPTWNNVRRVRALEDLSSVSGKYVVNDEPKGFGEVETGNRWTDCDLALGFGVLSRIFEVGTTFHLEAGLRNEELGETQQRCATDFIDGTRLIDDSVVLSFKNAGWDDSPVEEANFDDDDGCCVTRVYSGVGDDSIVVALGITGDPEIVMQNGWSLGELLVDREAIKVWRLIR